MLLHKVTERAKSPTLHAWKPVNILTVFATTPLPGDCKPLTRKPRTLSYPVSLASGDWQEFDLADVGFSNEFCGTLGDWSLFFNQTSKSPFNQTSNGR